MTRLQEMKLIAEGSERDRLELQKQLDAQRHRADKAEAELKAMGERYQKDLVLSRERWCYGNRADGKLAAAELKISELVAAFTPLIKHWDDLATGESANVDRARKALNQNSEGN